MNTLYSFNFLSTCALSNKLSMLNEYDINFIYLKRNRSVFWPEQRHHL